MKEEKIKIEELNERELLKIIYEEVQNNTKEIQNVRKELNEKIDYVYKELSEKIKYLDEKIKCLDEKIKYLDEKIDNTKNTLVKEIAEELKNISAISSERINNLEKKLDNEIEDRKVDISKVKDFNRIILNDIRSRVSILEEESEKYNSN